VSEPRARAIEGFRGAFGGSPAGIARAPGRLNLIGEHIDYCGLPVMPIALRRSVWLAFRAAPDDATRVATDAPGLGPRAFDARRPIPPAPPGDWSNYVRSAIETVARTGDRGLDAFVAADLPVAAGLSSSSALVVATALAWLHANGRPVGDRAELATRLALGERYVGTAGGGMDQAAALFGARGGALLVEFGPLRARPVPFPARWRIVVGHSGEAAEKSGAAQEVYNRRTEEAARGARAVAETLAVDADGGGLALYPRLLARYPAETLLQAARSLEPPLGRRFRHIVGEAERVHAMVAALGGHDLEAAGRLLAASQASLRDDYDVSTEALDEMVSDAIRAGAAGARLTGAGLGGCAIALCGAERAPAVLDAFRAYEARVGGPRVAFVAEPGAGAEVTSV